MESIATQYPSNDRDAPQRWRFSLWLCYLTKSLFSRGTFYLLFRFFGALCTPKPEVRHVDMGWRQELATTRENGGVPSATIVILRVLRHCCRSTDLLLYEGPQVKTLFSANVYLPFVASGAAKSKAEALSPFAKPGRTLSQVCMRIDGGFCEALFLTHEAQGGSVQRLGP